jgi:hypothetical protein
MHDDTLYLVTDIETDGPDPGPHSMLSFGCVATDGDAVRGARQPAAGAVAPAAGAFQPRSRNQPVTAISRQTREAPVHAPQ